VIVHPFQSRVWKHRGAAFRAEALEGPAAVLATSPTITANLKRDMIGTPVVPKTRDMPASGSALAGFGAAVLDPAAIR